MGSRFWQLVKDRLQGDLQTLIPELFGHAAAPRPRGRIWNVANPHRPGSRREQMVIWISGSAPGSWKDYVSDEKGDVIDLVAYAQSGAVDEQSRKDAVSWAADRYGLKTMDPKTRERQERQAAENKEKRELAWAAERARNRDRARKMFHSARALDLDLLQDSLIASYARSRGVVLANVPHLDLRSFHVATDFEYWMACRRNEEGRRIGPGPTMPAMVSAMRNQLGQIQACHLTYLRSDGRAKADVKRYDPEFSAKLMWPETAGSVIRVANGASGLHPEAAAEAGISGPCILIEGIEDGWSAAIAVPECRVWAAGSLSGLLHVPDHPCVDSWLVIQDNDWGKPQAKALFEKAAGRLAGFGKPVQVEAMPSCWGKDINDTLNSGAAA